MEFYLTYRGHIPAQKSSSAAIWSMRESFHKQLSKLWGKEPFDILKKQDRSVRDTDEPSHIKLVGDRQFVPFFGKHIDVCADLEIVLLTGMPSRKNALSKGDLDNRVKRIIDGLRCPQQVGELNGCPSDHRWYCLLEDDEHVSGLTVRLDTFLASDDVKESFAFIRIHPRPLRVTIDNLAVVV